MGRKRAYPIGYDRREVWEAKNQYHKSDRRKGYLAGYARAKSGKEMPDISARSEEYQIGYQKGWSAIAG